ncbi:9744_t:CDS:1 [Funneliformis caledonium]|uniref:9744_t:CDS:1 n=1 Tax=Funneliformis caledonium TaxID=1117310 RepID=A0A9N9AE50_9GLOM|nr:9744_t:CDS:1 [Funneliformis caledonium]
MAVSQKVNSLAVLNFKGNALDDFKKKYNPCDCNTPDNRYKEDSPYWHLDGSCPKCQVKYVDPYFHYTNLYKSVINTTFNQATSINRLSSIRFWLHQEKRPW